jgi:hypothetical protein
MEEEVSLMRSQEFIIIPCQMNAVHVNAWRLI